MPLVRIDVLEGRSPNQLQAIGDGVHRALVEAIQIPEDDRFQVHSVHSSRDPGGLVYDTGYLGIPRTNWIVVIQIVLSAGRPVEKKKALYAAIARNLAADPGVRPEDVFVNLVEVAKENWSFGLGVAQYADA
jgi:phenylpyruvate tautomerase PptA (4-oxalocrotonate tautomerase family)